MNEQGGKTLEPQYKLMKKTDFFWIPASGR
jgi:hypothetical protein